MKDVLQTAYMCEIGYVPRGFISRGYLVWGGGACVLQWRIQDAFLKWKLFLMSEESHKSVLIFDCKQTSCLTVNKIH